MNYDIYTGLLKAFPLVATEKNDVCFLYDNNHANYSLLKDKYPIEAVAGDGNDFSKAVNLLHWVSEHIYHKGDYIGKKEHTTLDLLDNAFDKELACGINCVGLAAILSDCLLAIGLKSRQVFIMPCSPYDGDNHVVTQVYVNETRKWVMLDPTFNAYVINENGDYMSLLDIRNRLANQKPVFFNSEAKYNDNVWTDESAKETIEYFAKNVFYFQTCEMSRIYVPDVPGNRLITLCPHGYNPKQMKLSNIDYRIRKYGENPFMLEWKRGAEQEEYIYCSVDDFEKSPN